jgi:geranyl-CoA carboxylase alpha subunit
MVAPSFSKILVANRGEIALRVMRTARRMGYGTVAVYSTADAAAPHVAGADEAVCIGPPPAAESYLDIAKIVAAAQRAGAGAVHPGYGFLSENAAFARACKEAGLTFIGPPADAIELMGNKARAKRAMAAAGVPCVPGSSGDDSSDDALRAAAEKIGFPVMIKAAAGGGGRGMRLVHTAADLADALRSARHEAKSAFGSDEVLLEKAIVAPRHIEIQIFGDTHGNVVHLGERDCSVQRRHQKVIEESPSPAVDAALREKMGAAAVLAGKSCGYTGAGTVELLLAQDREFYFLEMNTRLQVEHPVTEMVTGLDLVEWQIRVARGEPLPEKQAEIALSGHSIEARLYAEDPARDYMPQTGTVAAWRPAGDVRFDAGVTTGTVVSPYYDPMIAKVVAYAPTRDDARQKLAAALRDTTLFGVVTNKTFLANVLDHPGFAAGATTAFLAGFDDPSRRAEPPPPQAFALAALCAYLDAAAGFDAEFVGWASGSPIWSTVVLAAGDARRELRIAREGAQRFAVREGSSVTDVEVVSCANGETAYVEQGVRRRVRYLVRDEQVWIDDGRTVHVFDDVTHRPAARETAGTGKLFAPLDGKVVDLRAAPGDVVQVGQLLVVIEAMKMEHRIAADIAGEIAAIHVARGQQVKIRQPLIDIAAAQTEARA